MADIADKAQLLEDLQRQSAIRAALKASQKNEQLTPRKEAICDDCGEDISPQRLQVLPFAVRCTPCQNRHEREYRA